MFSTALSMLGTVALGAIGWFLTNFLAKPLLSVYELRQRVWEELLYTSNIGLESGQRYEDGVDKLRRLASQASALDVGWPKPFRWVLRHLGLDLSRASTGLLALSNTLASTDGSKLYFRSQIEKALLLPHSYTDGQIATIESSTLNDRPDPIVVTPSSSLRSH